MPPPPGDCASSLSEYRLVSFLRLRIAGEPLPATFAAHFHDADIYSADPDLLTMLFDAAPANEGESGSWFFFTHVRPKSSSDGRKSRQVAGGVGTWHSERAPRRVLDDEGNCAGHSQYFSYKLKIGNQRTEWYMVEFSDDQEAKNERVPGGEPQLVLSKIYKAHTLSRSGNGSASRPSCSTSALKRKAVDEAPAPPVKAKRQLFNSPAPASAARSQEQVRSTMQSNLICHPSSPGCITLKADGEAAMSQLKINDASFFSRLWPEPETAFGYTTTGGSLPTLDSSSSAPTARSQEQVSSTTRSGLMCHPSSPGCIALKAEGEAAASQLKIGDTSDFSRFWPEPETSFDYMTNGDALPALENCSYMTNGGALPALENCSWTSVRDVGDVFCGRDACPSGFHISNDTTTLVCGTPSAPALHMLENCSSTNVRDSGDVFCRRDTWPSAFCTSNGTTTVVCGTPSAPVLPMLENCSRTNVRDADDIFCRQYAYPSTFHTSNDSTAFMCGMPSAPILPAIENCTRTNVRDVGDVFCGQYACSSTFRTRNDSTAFMCGMPSAPVLLPGRRLGAAATAFGAADDVIRGSFSVH